MSLWRGGANASSSTISDFPTLTEKTFRSLLAGAGFTAIDLGHGSLAHSARYATQRDVRCGVSSSTIENSLRLSAASNAPLTS